MAKKTIGLEVDIPVGKAEENVKNLQQRLEELKKTLYDLDEADPNFDKMAKEAAMMEDKIADVNQRVKQLSSDTKNLEGFTATVQGVAGGFAAAAGAAALFGDESEDLQKQMLQVQSALTMLNGVQEVANQLNKDSAAAIFLKTQAQKAYTLAVGTSTGAMKLFRLALIATGVGALVVTLGAIIANWDKISKAVKENTKGLIDFGEVFNKVKAVAMGVFNSVIAYYKTLFDIIKKAIDLDFEGAIESAKNLGKNVVDAYNEGFQEQVERNEEANRRKLIEASLGDTKRLLARLEAQGKDTYNLRKKLLQDELQLLEQGSEEYLNKQNEIYILQYNREKEFLDGIAKLREENQREVQGIEKEGIKEVEERTKTAGDKMINSIIEQNQKALEQYQRGVKIKKDAEDRKLKQQQEYEDNLRELQVSSALGIASALGEINDAFAGKSEAAARKQFNIQKALSLAETVISTYSAAQKAYASQLSLATPDAPIRAAVAAGVAIASGLARVAAISKQQFESTGNASVQPTSQGQGPSAQATPQITQDVTRTRLGANDQGELKLKVFVTESDITNTQKKVNRIERRATVE